MRRRFCAALACALAATACGAADVPDPAVLAPTEVMFAPARADGTPEAFDAAAWQPVTLPHAWEKLAGPRPRTGWYRAELELDVPPDRLWACTLPRVAMNAAVYLNGELLGDGGRFDPPVSRNWNRPLHFTISSGLLLTGTNVFHVRVESEPWERGRLDAIWIGPDESLRPGYEQRFLARVTVSRAVCAMVFVVSAFAAALWWRRGEAIYGWFAAATLLWSLATLDLFVRDVPVAAPAWGAAVRIVRAAFLVGLIGFFHRLRGTPRAGFELGLALGLALAALALLLVGDVERPLVDGAFGVLCLGLGLYLAFAILALFRERPSFETGAVVLLGIGMLGLTAHDWIVQLLPGSPRGDPVAHLGVPLFAAAVGWALVSRFVGALEETETLNRELEGRVRQKHAELERSFLQTRQMERDGALATERERIMRDMHDGMGGHLVSALSLVESGAFEASELTEVLRSALEDMRLVIDSLDPVDEDLPTVLSMLRTRLEPRLKRHGLAFQWHVGDLPPIPGMSPQRVLQVLRILQEALTNVLKHAEASAITVTTGHADDGRAVFVEVADDGRGIPEDVQRGRGLYNMERRAEAAGGRLEIRASDPGTRVRLWLTLEPAPERSSFSTWLEALQGERPRD